MIILRIDNFLSEVIGDSPEDIAHLEALREFFSVKDPDYYQKQKAAAGKYKVEERVYFYTSSRKLRTGLLPALIVFLNSRDLKIGYIEDLRVGMPTARAIGDRTYTYGHTMAEHQVRCVNSYERFLVFPTTTGGTIVPFYRGIIDAVVNSGKTLMMMGAIDFFDYGARQVKALVLVTKGLLANQHFQDFSKFFPTAIYGKGRIIPKDTCVIVSTTQAILAALKAGNDLPEHNMLLIDECHEVASATYTEILNKSNAPVRLGFSGTPYDNSHPLSKFMTIGNISDTIQKVEYTELREKGVSRKLKTYIYSYSPKLDPLTGLSPQGYDQQMRDYIFNGVDRMNIILKLVAYYMEHDAKILITFDRLAHGMFMYEQVKTVVKEDRVVFTHGKDRSSIKKIESYTKDGYKNILIVSSIARQGLNMPIDVILNAQGGKSVKEAQQWAGRGVRLREGTDDIILIDFMDQSKHLFKHSVARIEAYKDEGYPVELMYSTSPKSKYKPVIL
jgi:superfamily II DNA or RNA helicase